MILWTGARPGSGQFAPPEADMTKGDVGAGVERIIDQFLQDDFAQISRLTSGLLWQRRQVGEQPPVFGFVDELLPSFPLTLLALALRSGCARSSAC